MKPTRVHWPSVLAHYEVTQHGRLTAAAFGIQPNTLYKRVGTNRDRRKNARGRKPAHIMALILCPLPRQVA